MSNDEISHNDILGRRTVKPRTVPFGYQVEQWERQEQAFESAKLKNPQLNPEDFLIGWNAAFSEVYGG